MVVIILGLSTTASAHFGPGMVVDDKGNIYFLMFAPGRILKVDPEGKISVDFSDPTKIATLPHHLVIDDKGNLYAPGSMKSGGVVWKISPDQRASQFYPRRENSTERTHPLGRGDDPFTVDRNLNIYTVSYRDEKGTDQNLQKIVKSDAKGKAQFVAGDQFGYADGKGKEARFEGMNDGTMALGPDGGLYVTDGGTMVRKITADGTVTTLAGSPEKGFADGPGKTARFSGARGIAVDKKGNVFIADEENCRIRRVSPEGKVDTLAGSGKSRIEDGPALQAAFSGPIGVAVAVDTIFVLDVDESKDVFRIRKVTPGGLVKTLAAMQFSDYRPKP